MLFVFLFLAAQTSFGYDTIPKMINRHGVYLDWRLLTTGIGYTLNHWTGIGYRNYFSLNCGVDYLLYPIQQNKNGFGVSAYFDHNHRTNLYKLNYFSYGVGYGLAYFLKPAEGIQRDEFKNQFWGSMGFNIIQRKFKFAFLFNIIFIESKQQVNLSTRTYLRIYPTFTFRYSYFFKQKDISEER